MAASASVRSWASSGMAAHPTFHLVQGDRGGHRDVQRLRAAWPKRDPDNGVGRLEHLGGQALALGAQADDGRPVAEPHLLSACPLPESSATRRPGSASRGARAGGRAKIEPMLARTALGEKGSAQPGPSTTVASASACAERTIAPTFPGSSTPCRYTSRSAAAAGCRAER